MHLAMIIKGQIHFEGLPRTLDTLHAFAAMAIVSHEVEELE